MTRSAEGRPTINVGWRGWWWGRRETGAAAAHASRFVRPAAVRIESNEVAGLANVAFKLADGRKALIDGQVDGGDDGDVRAVMP